MLLHAEFLAILLVLVYVGAVMVLFLFVVMMLVGRLGNTLWYAICNGKQIMANNGNADDDIMPA